MISTYEIRAMALKDHLNDDNDYGRYHRQLSRLSLDISAHLKRCVRAGDDCNELRDLLDYIDGEMFVAGQMREQEVA